MIVSESGFLYSLNYFSIHIPSAIELRVKQNKGTTDFHHHFEGSTPAGEINSSNAPQLGFNPSHQDLHD